MKSKSQIAALSVSALGSYGLLKLPKSKIDPYTRFTFGVLVGSVMVFSKNPLVRFAGVGIGISGFFQILDVFKGGRLSFNNGSQPVFVLHEEKGVIELQPNETPDYNIDGFTVKGMNGVFKLSDGVYGGVNSDNSAVHSIGVGFIVNKMRNAGLKSKNWVDVQTDKRWLTLYEKSL